MQLTKNSQSNALIGFSMIGFALPLYLLLLSGFPTFDAIKVCAMIFVQIVSGAVVWAQVMHPRQVDIVESVGMGLALGSILAVIGHQLFLPTALDDFGWLLPVVVALISSLAWRSTKGSYKNFVLDDLAGLFFVAFAVVLILKQWWWLLPLSVPTGLALYLLSSSGRNKLQNNFKTAWWVVAVSFVAATVLMVYLRQLNLDWWIRSWDLQYFESRSYSIAKFGRNENISLVGYPIQYHWFGLAWLGSITVITNIGPWLATTQVAPVYSVIAIGCLIFAIAKRTSSNQLTRYAILAAFAFVLSGYSPANVTNIVSMIWFFSALVVAQQYFDGRTTRVFIIFASLAFAALSSKVSAGFTLLAVFTLTDIWMNRGTKPKVVQGFVHISVLLIGSIGSYFYVIGGPQRYGDDHFSPKLRNPAIYFGVEAGREKVIFLIATIGFLLLLVPSFVSLVFLPKRFSERQPVITFCIFGLIPLLIASFMMEENLGYFILSAKSLFLIGSAIVVTSPNVIASFSAIKTRTKLIFLSIALLTAQANQSFYELNWREISTLRGGPTPILVLILVTYYLVSFVYVSIFTSRHHVFVNNSTFRARLAMLSIFLLIGSVAPPVFSHFRSLPSKMESNDQASVVAGSVDSNSASKWLNLNSSDDQIVATNRFCIESATLWCFDPKYFGVSATTRRLILIEGPFYLFGHESLYPIVGQDRLDLSIGFADQPTAEIAAKLRELGVDWFYLFLQNTDNRNWAPFATVEYQNDEVAILKLAEP